MGLLRWLFGPVHKPIIRQPTPQMEVAIPIMITKDTRQQLYDLRYTKDQVDNMTPIQAAQILEKANGNSTSQK